MLRVRLCGGVELASDGGPLPASSLAGRQGRLVLAYLVCERHRAVSREELADLLWPDELPSSWSTSLSAVISKLRRLFVEAGLDGAATLVSAGNGYRLSLPDGTWVDWEAARSSIAGAEAALARGDGEAARAAAADARAIAEHGFVTDPCEWADAGHEALRDVCVRSAIVEAEAHLREGSAGRAVEAAREAVAHDILREEGYRVLMRALAAAGERAEALRVWEQCRATLAEELGADPSSDTEAVYLDILGVRAAAAATPLPGGGDAGQGLPSGVVTFLLTDIVGSSGLWERAPAGMVAAIERHDALVEKVVATHGGTLLKSKLEGDATVSVFGRATGGALAALALREALAVEEWPEGAAPTLRMALHTGEAFERDGDYFGPALNRAARLRSLAGGDQILLSQAVAELVRDHLPAEVALADLGHHDLRGLSRGENVFELVAAGAEGGIASTAEPIVAPPLPVALESSGPFVGRGDELGRLGAAWEQVLVGTSRAVLLAGEPGVGKSRLAAEWARRVHGEGAVVLTGRCDEELGAPLQPFVEAVRLLVPVLGPARLTRLPGADALARLVPEVADVLPGEVEPARGDPETERYALFDAITRALGVVSADAPVLLVLDDLHWAGKTTLMLLRHLLRSSAEARVMVVGTYRDTELARTHPLSDALAELHRDGATDRVTLGGLGTDEVGAYLEAVGYADAELGPELAQVTAGNPFFFIEVVRHLDETGGSWESGTLPQGVRETTGRRLSRLSDEANEALAVAAVAGTTFELDLVEQVRGRDLVDEMAAACQAGLIVEEGRPGTFRFAHAIVRQVLLGELVTVKRVRMHRTIAELLEASTTGDPEARLTELAHHWFECASAGSAGKAVTACRRAAEDAMERLAYEYAADLYDMALQALELMDDSEVAADRADLLLRRCGALLTAGEVAGARSALAALEREASGSPRLAAWHVTLAAELAVLGEPERLREIVGSIPAAASALRAEGDTAGEGRSHYVHALALQRLGQIGEAEAALDAALAASRAAGDERLAGAVLALAPQAALWGPSPVTRASGRCLDVVRVLRIAGGAPAVEAVALRSQGVLEALRGRMDAARRMLRSALRTFDEVGVALRRIETEVLAGYVELLDGQAGAAEAHLAPAYRSLGERGLGGEAALAGALLARALVQLGRVDDAVRVAGEASETAGDDLHAAIAWRVAMSEAIGAQGDGAEALDLARQAVETAEGTDALVLVADARLALAAALRAGGDEAGARAEERRALTACEAKGATTLASRARPEDGVAGDEGTAQGGAASHRAYPGLVLEPGRFVNDAVIQEARVAELWNARDWDGVWACFAPDVTTDDRSRFGAGTMDAAQVQASFRRMFDYQQTKSVEWRSEVIATRGRSLALFRRRFHAVDGRVGPVENGGLSINLVDSKGLRKHSVLFEIDDVGAAYDELDRLFAEGEAAAFPALWGALRETNRLHRSADWNGLAARLAPDFRLEDHALLGWGRLDATRYLASVREFKEMRPDAAARLRHVLAIDEHRALTVGCNADGADADFQINRVMVFAIDDAGRTRLQEMFDLDDLDAAWTAYRRLGGPGAAGVDGPGSAAGDDGFETSATRNMQASREAMSANDWDAWRALFRDDYVAHERTGAPLDVAGDDYFASMRRGVGEADVRPGAVTVLATRGDRLVLYRGGVTGTWAGSGDFAIDMVGIHEVDGEGLRVRSVVFSPDKVDDAYRMLDQWFLEGEAAGAGALWQKLTALAGASTIRHAPLVDARRALCIRERGDGAALIEVVVAGGGGRITARHEYPADRFDEARAHFERLGGADPFENTAVRVISEFDRLFNARDWDAWVQLVRPDFVRADRRQGVHVELAGDEWFADMRLGFEQTGLTQHSTILATRGDRLALLSYQLTGTWGPAPGDVTIEHLYVAEVDEQGRLRRGEKLDPDDFEAAYRTLDDWYVEGEGAEHAPAVRALAAVRDGMAAGEGSSPFVANDVVIEDRRRIVANPMSIGELRDLRRDGRFALRDVVGDEVASGPFGHVTHIPRLGRSAMVFVTEFSGNVRDGGALGFSLVWLVQHAGRRVERLEVYDLDDLSVALRRFEDVEASAGSSGFVGDTPDGYPFANAAVRRAWASDRAWNEGAWDPWRALVAPGHEIFDRRFHLGNADGFDFVTGKSADSFSGPKLVQRSVPVATRGNRLALVRMTFTGEAGSAGETLIEALSLQSVNADGLLERVLIFDAGDEAEARAELDDWYAAGEAAAHAAAWAAFRAGFGRPQDWSFTPDFHFGEHRRVGWGQLGADGLRESFRRITELTPEWELRLDHVLGISGRGCCFVTTFAGTWEGGPAEMEAVWVVEWDRSGELVRWDGYEVANLVEARDRWAELGDPAGGSADAGRSGAPGPVASAP